MQKPAMRPCHVVEIVTPKKCTLYGLWYGPKKARRVVIFIHGLTGSMFSSVPREFPSYLVDTETAVLSFNNRGHGIVNRVHRGKRYLTAGSAHELFTDCVDDIRGAVNITRKQGVTDIYLAGHSTGCQKAVYYAFKMGKKSLIKALILLAPVSDHGVAVRDDKNGRLARIVKIAQKLLRSGKKHEMLPQSPLTKWSIDDAQRFLSLYTPDSPETIFPYEQKEKVPRTLRGVKLPMLVLWAAKDEYADRPAKDIKAWFEKHIRAPHQVVIVPKTEHGFKGAEKRVAADIRRWIKAH